MVDLPELFDQHKKADSGQCIRESNDNPMEQAVVNGQKSEWCSHETG
jgi:hypothetical protein